jgi:hypothetical protein
MVFGVEVEEFEPQPAVTARANDMTNVPTSNLRMITLSCET